MGHNPDDVEKYTCHQCKVQYGWKKFLGKQMCNFKYEHRLKLECQMCTFEVAKKVSELQLKLKQSKRVCKCFCLLHTENANQQYVIFKKGVGPVAMGIFPKLTAIFLINSTRSLLGGEKHGADASESQTKLAHESVGPDAYEVNQILG